jgi:hypothetical protein
VISEMGALLSQPIRRGQSPSSFAENIIVRRTVDIARAEASAKRDPQCPTKSKYQPQPETPKTPPVPSPILPWPVAAKPELASIAPQSQKGRVSASKAAHDAYRNALPPLSGVENIRDFIACVAHGILIDSIRDCVAARLLYAAQVASNVSRQTSAKKPSAG